VTGVHRATERLGALDSLDAAAGAAANAVKGAVKPGAVKDFLSGTWLGHPLHPLLTDVPIGAFTSAALLDLVGGRKAHDAADALVAIGLASALPTAAAGASDWSDTYGPDQRVGVVHAASNVVGLVLYGASLLARRRGRRATGKLLGLAGMAAMTVGGYLGGYLSYSRGVGVNNAFFETGPDDWTSVLADAELAEGKPVRVEASGASVLLYKRNDRILAIGARCSHAGGPLEEGSVDRRACTVQCPWHGSVFRLDDGRVVHGPATSPQAAYDVRVRDGRVEIRRPELVPA
jgi:nitrite reductase/ring-hydroxylating ferredoxin subunit/uncharacterized membrane protein